jgi:hypothetical protein
MQRQLLLVTDRVFYNHLSGQHTVGVYILLSDDTCFFLAIDFDEADWRHDAQAFMVSCRDVCIYDYVEKDRPQLVRMWEKRQHG